MTLSTADETLRAELDEWLGGVVLDHARDAMQQQSFASLTLVATPNVEVGPFDIRAVATDFGERQLCRTSSWTDL